MDGFCLSFTVTKPLVDGLWFVSREDGYAIKGKNIPCTMEKSDVGIWLFAWLQYRHLRKCFFMKRLALNCMSCSCWKVPTHSYIKKKPVLLQIYNLIYIISLAASIFKLFYKWLLTKRFICGKIVVQFKVKVAEVIVHRYILNNFKNCAHSCVSDLYIHYTPQCSDEAALNMRGIKCGIFKRHIYTPCNNWFHTFSGSTVDHWFQYKANFELCVKEVRGH